MKITEEKIDNIIVMTLEGAIDSHSAGGFETAVCGVLDDGARAIVFDMGGVEYISSTGLRVLLLAIRQLHDDGKMAVAAVHMNVKEVFDHAGFSNLFPIFSTRQEAIEAVQITN